MANILWTQILGAMHLARIRVGMRQAAPGVPELFTVDARARRADVRRERAGDRRRPAVKLGRVEPQLRSVAATRYVEPCGRAGRCPGSWRPTTTGSTSPSTAARGRGRRRSWPRSWSASWRGARAARCPSS